MQTGPVLVAFHNDKAIKAKYLARIARHRKADNLIRGQGWNGHRGCAIGCTLEVYDHSRYPIELGIPLELARLEDVIFEGMPAKEAMKWPGEFLRAIPVGADLSDVWPQFAIWLLEDVRKHARDDGKKAIDTVVGLYQERAPRTDARWAAAANAAARYATAANAAHAARYAAYAAANATNAARYATAANAAYAAANAAYAAANATNAANAVRSGAYYQQSRRLLDIIRRTRP